MELVYPNEQRLFRIALVLAVIVWAVIILGTFGIALLYIGLFFLFAIFAHSAFITHVRGNGVKVTAEQYPDLKPPPPLDEGLQQQFTTLVTEAFGDTSTKLDVIVQEGHPIEQFSRLAKNKDVDLIMMGRKKELKGSGNI